MTRVFVTGDVHGVPDSISFKKFPVGRTLTKDDYVIIAGDFGLPWYHDKEEKFWLKWLEERPWTTLFIDGNHENFEELDAMPLEEWNGGLIHRIRPNILHLTRGQVFQLGDKSFFTFGGAASIDKADRKDGVNYWSRELPSAEEYQQGIDVLNQHNWAVDVVITHTCPEEIRLQFPDSLEKKKKGSDEVNEYLQTIKDKLSYTHWFFGHFHADYDFGDGMQMLLKKIVEV